MAASEVVFDVEGVVACQGQDRSWRKQRWRRHGFFRRFFCLWQEMDAVPIKDYWLDQFEKEVGKWRIDESEFRAPKKIPAD